MKSLFTFLISLPLLLFSVFSSLSLADFQVWQSTSGEHFDVYFKGEKDSFSAEVLSKAEYHRDQMVQKWEGKRGGLKSWKKSRCKIYLVEGNEDYFELTHRPPWSKAASRHYPEKVIVGQRGSRSFLVAELPHEIAHLVFRDLLELYGDALPLWIDEGVALMAEEEEKNSLAKHWDAVIANQQWIPLAELNRIRDISEIDSARVATFYAQSESLVQFLVDRFGRPAFVRFCRLLGRGTPIEKCLQKIFGAEYGDLDHLEDAWVSFLKNP